MSVPISAPDSMGVPVSVVVAVIVPMAASMSVSVPMAMPRIASNPSRVRIAVLVMTQQPQQLNRSHAHTQYGGDHINCLDSTCHRYLRREAAGAKLSEKNL